MANQNVTMSKDNKMFANIKNYTNKMFANIFLSNSSYRLSLTPVETHKSLHLLRHDVLIKNIHLSSHPAKGAGLLSRPQLYWRLSMENRKR